MLREDGVHANCCAGFKLIYADHSPNIHEEEASLLTSSPIHLRLALLLLIYTQLIAI